MDLHIRHVILRYNGLLLSKITHTLKYQVRGTGSNLHIQLLTQGIHIPANLLQVHTRHVNNAREVQRRNLDILHIRIEQLQKVVGDSRLLGILHTNTQLIGIIRRHIERERIVVPHRLNELEKVDHIHTEHMLCRAIEGFELIGM